MDFILDSSHLNRRITLQQRSASKDSFGQESTNWTDYLTCWARIEPLSGRELIAAQAQQAETTHEIVIRYRPGIVPAMRAVYQGRIFNVLSVIDPEMAHAALQLQCSEGLTQG